MSEERRKSQRLEIPKAIAVNHDISISQVVNLSNSGLCLQSLRKIDWPSEWLLDIIISATTKLEGFPVKLAWAQLDEYSNDSLFKTETCGVKFGNLSKYQEKKLNLLFSKEIAQ